jgi:hypothetical protein
VYLYGCQQVLLYSNNELKAVLEFICQQANSLINCGIYYARQLYFKAQKLVGKYDLEAEYKTNNHFKANGTKISGNTYDSSSLQLFA